MTVVKYNSTIVDKLLDEFKPPNNISISNVIIDNFKSHLQDLDHPIPENLNIHSVLSRIGYKLEKVICHYALEFNDQYKLYVGDDFKKEVISYKHNPDPVLKEQFLSEYLFSEDFVDEINSMKSIHFPDIILIDKENNTIKIAEIKSSGENDSTSVPGNINKLVEGKIITQEKHGKILMYSY